MRSSAGAAARRPRVRARLAVAAVAAVLAVTTPALISGAARAGTGRTPGPAVTAHWSTQALAPGVTVRSGVLKSGVTHSWTVSVQVPSVLRFSSNDPDAPVSWSEVSTRAWADATAKKLTEAGLQPRVEAVEWPRYADTPHGVMGYRVRVGRFATKDQSQGTVTAVNGLGLHATASWTGYDVQEPADLQHVHVAVIDPRTFSGQVEATHDGNVADRVTTSAVARKLHSLVGVNGGFFVMTPNDGVPGVMSAIGAYDGELASMAVGARSALIIDDGRRFRTADLTSTVTVRSGDAAFRIQGINRRPGTVRDCGRPGARPSELPWQDVTCQLDDDMVQFTPAFQADLPTGPGTQVVLDASGSVVSVGARGGRVPVNGRVLQGIGRAADWLTAHAKPGQRLTVSEVVRDSEGRRVELGAGDSLLSAAPTLLQDGRIDIDAAAEGVVDPEYPHFGYAWANVRQPRTMAGVDKQGRLILATVDGRLKGGSEGFTLYEAATFMKSLGAVQAINLDGGGSTAMAVKGALVNQPSDATGERAVGDTLQVLPAAG
ncbi:sporulation protein [Streptomyces sp. Ru71]|uniref:phosphodiester glycosidase family protein n=1 Tax=Streptomyces sp. Ru71 TaxID=2080746 RepID=UPI000CDDA8A9|nr:phosphodiester glycosidase family protein [Streptomyces sp. Ru71]POX56308.1 sporulation protein [Streptomyces sp. Ru71]